MKPAEVDPMFRIGGKGSGFEKDAFSGRGLVFDGIPVSLLQSSARTSANDPEQYIYIPDDGPRSSGPNPDAPPRRVRPVIQPTPKGDFSGKIFDSFDRAMGDGLADAKHTIDDLAGLADSFIGNPTVPPTSSIGKLIADPTMSPGQKFESVLDGVSGLLERFGQGDPEAIGELFAGWTTTKVLPNTRAPVGRNVSPIFTEMESGLNAYYSKGDISTADLSRLARDGQTRSGTPYYRTGEGLAAAEFEQVFNVRLERVVQSVTENPPDFRIRGGQMNGKTVDFLYTMDSSYALKNFNANFLKNGRAERAALANIIKHVNKADFVPMDFRAISSANQNILITKIIPQLTEAQQAKLLIIRGGK